MLKQATIIFDDINLSFDVSVVGSASTERLKNGNFIVSYNLHSDYGKGSREIYTTNANLTNAFNLNVIYYKNSTELIASENVLIRASTFTGINDTPKSIGIDVDKYLTDYYNPGVITNLNGLELTYGNLAYLGTVIINYAPIQYNLTISYMMDNGDGKFFDSSEETITFTYQQLQSIQTIGQLIKPQTYQPEGYKSNIVFTGELTVENILAQSPIIVLYQKIPEPAQKIINIEYYRETDNGDWAYIDNANITVKETEIYDGSILGDLIDVSLNRPDEKHYNNGYIVDNDSNTLISFEDLELDYQVRYPRTEHTIYVEYYAGTYPSWYRILISTLTVKYKDSFANNFSLTELGVDLNRCKTKDYEPGAIYNSGSLDTYDNVITAGIIQVYYVPVDYEITVRFMTDDDPTINQQVFTINILDFFGSPSINDIIPIGDYRPEGYQLDTEHSYQGVLGLDELLEASPITITFTEIEADQTKNIIIRYKQELASTFSTLNTSLISINKSDCIGGVRLKDIINLDLYKPTYYESGVIDKFSQTALVEFDDIESSYDVLYMASYYSTPVRYYTDDIDDANWVGSASVSYRIIDFETTTTLFDLGLDLNMFKPSYSDDGVCQYNGPVNFLSLRELYSIDIIYETIEEPDGDDGIDYPHRFLYTWANDFGAFETTYPNLEFKHSYINTGFTCEDMARLTITMECEKVDRNTPFHDINGPYGYLFGSDGGVSGAFYMRFNNQTTHHAGELTGVNTYEAQAGYRTPVLTLTEQDAVGFSANTGIYASAQNGYSNATFTYTNPLAVEDFPYNRIVYPIYLFANNNGGRYEYGIGGIGIYGCRIYYNNVLVRDFIPVQTYDKIGDLIAPSNCLYDKITKTFFEDASGHNGFNIRDDDRYVDTNPAHKIGWCYVNYYKDSVRFKTNQYYFRGDDFIDGKTYDPFEEWEIEDNQPLFYKPGVITDIENISFTFNGLNGQVFNVLYEEDENNITVNYYRDDNDGSSPVLIKTDTITLSQKDFYQVPTFGDIVRLNKYKPIGYKTDYEFPETKVSLARVLAHSPYSIIYTPETEPLQDYTTTIKYIKKVYGIRTYETIAEEILHFDQTDFRDGEYIDFYIDMNLHKPERFYVDGDYYQWYEMDERLDSPENLKEVYTVVYECDRVYTDVNYYTDEWHEENLIASTTWSYQLDDFDPEYPFYLVDQLPNEYINKYRPKNCDGGKLQNSNVEYTFYTLADLNEIAIVYETLTEPNDPTTAHYEKRILCFGDLCNRIYPSIKDISQALTRGVIPHPLQVPYVDLGYRPKEIGRLRVELTGCAKPVGVYAPPSGYSVYNTSYATLFGYRGAPNDFIALPNTNYNEVKLPESIANPLLGAMDFLDIQHFDPVWSKGEFYIQPRIPSTEGAFWIWNYGGPSSIDGQHYIDNVMTTNKSPANIVYYIKPGMIAKFRRGLPYDVDENYEPVKVFNPYTISKTYSWSEVPDIQTNGYMSVNSDRLMAQGLQSFDDTQRWDNQTGDWVGDYFIANPFTVVLDAYNNYGSIWNYHDSNYPFTWKLQNDDNPIWEDIERPRGSLSLFTSTNPTTGNPNVLDDFYWAYPSLASLEGGMSMRFQQTAIGANPYDASSWKIKQNGEEETAYGYIKTTIRTKKKDDSGKTITTEVPVVRNVHWADWVFPSFPWLAGACIWSLKIYDRDRLVRDLIPVAKGDKVYDYIMPENGLFDLITEIFFGDSNPGQAKQRLNTVGSESEDGMFHYQPFPLYAIPDFTIYGKITTNYYDYDNTFLTNKFVDVPTWFCGANTTIEEILEWNNYKPDDYHLDGWLDVDQDWSWWGNKMNLAQIYEMGSVNVYYRLRTFTKTVVYYRDNVRVGSRDIMYSLRDIKNATTLEGLGINVDLYYDPHYKHGRVVYNEQIIADDNIEAFINAPSPIVVYDKLTKEEAPNILYVEYYRGGAYDDNLITLDENDVNYLNCDLTARVLNPNGAIKYFNHYHQALYEDENFGEFIPYQVRVLNKYTGLHYGPARKYKTLAMIVLQDVYTIIQERNGWGRLKEYPNAWILLTQTEPITGPGQNPDYDVADTTVATIPFGEYIDISKMTIDRLWCYVPAVESWIKAEDISFNQAGKLYNGLQIQAIDLDKIDFSNVSSLADMGIDIQKYVMRFHDESDYVYTGDYSYNAFSNLHEIDIVYPETIYNYSCRYYKDNKAENNYLGASAFSCSISDWNPDWDKFIETSWQTVPINGEAVVKSGTLTSGNVNIRSTTDMNSELVGQVPIGDTVEITGPSQIVGNYTWYPVLYNDLAGYIRLNNLTIKSEYGGVAEVNPTLYRDTVMTLDWEYFGFIRNLYKPEGYSDGIYLWNPRSWDKDNIKFSFEELIRCGTQYVIYPIFDPNTYKIWIQGNYLGLTYQYKVSGDDNYRFSYMNNPGIKIDLSDAEHNYNLYKDPHYSLYGAGEWRNDLGYSTNYSSGNYFYINPDKNAYYNTRLGAINFASASGLKFNGISMPLSQKIAPSANNVPVEIGNIKNGDVLIGEVSNYRYSPTGVVGIGNDYENRERHYYIVGTTTSLQDNINLIGYHTEADTSQSLDLREQWCRGVVYEVISYYDFMMIHYYVPVPKGLWYRYNGETLRIPDNGLFDLLTGEFKQGFRASKDSNMRPTGFTGTLGDGKEFIFLRNQSITDANPYDLFNGWEYNTKNVELYKRTTTSTIGYAQPDEYSIQINQLTPGLVMPISKQTVDNQNKVVGNWDMSCDQWIKREDLETISGFSYSIKEENATYSLVPGTISNFYVYNDPMAVGSAGEHSDYSYGNQSAIIKFYYSCATTAGGMLFDGAHWVPRIYTSSATTPLNKNYVITQDTNYYEYPIAKNEYRKGSYLYGERITVLEVCSNNSDWGYTGQGWIQIDGNTSEVL